MNAFIQSLHSAFLLLLTPRVFLFFIIILIFYLLFARAIRYFSEQKESEEGASAGCLTQVVAAFVQGLFTAGFVMLLIPILFGVTAELSWSAVEPLGFVAARAGLIAILGLSLMTMLPCIGVFLASSPGLEVFLLAGLVFRLTTPSYLSAFVPEESISALFPNIWQTLVYFLFVILLTRLAMFFVFMLSKYFSQRQQLTRAHFCNKTLGPCLDLLLGLFGFLLYAQHVRISLNI